MATFTLKIRQSILLFLVLFAGLVQGAHAIATVTTPSAGTYLFGETLTFTAVYDVDITSVSGNPRVRLAINNDLGVQTQAFADLQSFDLATDTLVFSYTIDADYIDSDGIIYYGSLNLLDGTPQICSTYIDVLDGPTEQCNTDSETKINASANVLLSSVLVESTTPDPVGDVSVPSSGTYIEGESLDFSVTFNEAVLVSGTPYIEVTIGSSAPVKANYNSAMTTSDTVVFSYVIAAGLYDSDGVAMGTSILYPNSSASIRDSAGNDATATLTYAANPVTGVLVDSEAPGISSRTLPASGTYKSGDTLVFQITYDETVLVSGVGTPTLPIVINGNSKSASYTSGSGSTTLQFEYVIEPGFDVTGISLGASQTLGLPAGTTITDIPGNDAQTDLSQDLNGTSLGWDMSGVDIDSVAPTFSGATVIPTAGTYSAGDTLTFVLDYSEEVAVTGNPQLELTIDSPSGSQTKYADYVSDNALGNVTFAYVVESGLLDSDGIGLSTNLVKTNGSIADLAGNAAATVFTLPTSPNTISTVKIDSVAPSLAASTPFVAPANGTYPAGFKLTFKVNYDEAVVVDGSPRLVLSIDSPIGVQTGYAVYDSGSSSSTSIAFSYTVAPELLDSNGISVAGSIDTTNGSLADAAGNVAALDISGVLPSFAGLLIDSFGPEQTGLLLTDQWYGIGDPIDITVQYDIPVLVNFTDINPGRPYIQLNVGGVTKKAEYYSGSSTSNIVFRYTVQGGDSDTNGIAISPLQITVPVAASLKDEFGNDAVTDLTGVVANGGNYTGVLVDGTAPTISNLTGPQSSVVPYGAGLNLDFVLQFPEAVYLVDSNLPFINLDIGGNIVKATYLSGEGTQALTFRHVLSGSSGLEDTDGIQISSSSVEYPLTGGIVDGAGNPLATTLPTPFPDLTGVKVDTIAPDIDAILGVEGPVADTYGVDTSLSFVVHFDESVRVNTSGGTPSIALNIGGQTKQATYRYGSDSSQLVFSYTVEAGLVDGDGIQVTSDIVLNGGTIRDDAGNDALLDITAALPDLTAVLVDSDAPGISSVTAPPAGLYKAGDKLTLTVTYNQDVAVASGPATRPYIELDISDSGTGPNLVLATYDPSTSTATELYFSYTVATGLSDNNGIKITSTAIALNGASIIDAYGNAAGLNLNLITSDYPAVLVDAVAPSANGWVTQPASGTYATGAVLEFSVPFDENVKLSGTPRLPLEIGGGTYYALATGLVNSTTVNFAYTVDSGLTDVDGIVIKSPLETSMGHVTDLAGNNANPALPMIPLTDTLLIDSVLPAVDQTLAVPVNDTYVAAEVLEFSVHFSKPVLVTGGTPRLQLLIGPNGGATNQYADLVPTGSASNLLTFRYTIANGLVDTDGIQLLQTMDLNGATIKDALGNSALTSLSGWIPSLTGVFVNASAPLISGDLIIPAAGTYSLGQTLDFFIPYSKVVAVAGSPFIGVIIDTPSGQVTKNATYLSTIGTTSLIGFRYTIEAGLLDVNGIQLVSPVDVTAGSIQDAAGNPADLDIAAHIPPGISAILIDSDAAAVDQTIGVPSDGTYVEGQTMGFSVHFNQAVSVIGSPRLVLDVGGTPQYATYVSGSGSQTLVFQYVVAAGMSDLNGIGLADSIDLNGGAILDGSSNDASISLKGFIPTLASVWVDANTPGLVSAKIVDANLNQLVLEYNRTLDGTSIPSTGAFSVQVGGSLVTVTNVEISLKEVRLLLARKVYIGELVLVSYTPGGTPLKDTNQTAVAALTEEPVNNLSTLHRANLLVSVDNGKTTIADGSLVDYTVVVSNPGPEAVTSANAGPAEVQVTLNQGLQNFVLTSITTAGGASRVLNRVPVPSPIYEYVNLPVGGSITYKFRTTADSAAGPAGTVTAKVRQYQANPLSTPTTGPTEPGTMGYGVYGRIAVDSDIFVIAACSPDASGNVTIDGVSYGSTYSCTAPGTITATNTIVGSSLINANVTFTGGTSVVLGTGFSVAAGSTFHAVIGTASAREYRSALGDGGSGIGGSSLGPNGGMFGSGRLTWDELPAELRDLLGSADSLIDGASSDASGDLLVFSTEAPLVIGDGNDHADVYLYRVNDGFLDLVSANLSGIAGNGPSTDGSIDAEGEFVIFRSLASDLVASDTNGAADIFLRDLLTASTQRIPSPTGLGDAGGSSIGRKDAAPVILVDVPMLDGSNAVFQYFPLDAVEAAQLSATGESASKPEISADGEFQAWVVMDEDDCAIRINQPVTGHTVLMACPADADSLEHIELGLDGQWLEVWTRQQGGQSVTEYANPLY